MVFVLWKEAKMLEDKLLILRFNRGYREALHQIYDKYKNDLVTLASALLTDVALAEDVVHDVFIGFVYWLYSVRRQVSTDREPQGLSGDLRGESGTQSQ